MSSSKDLNFSGIHITVDALMSLLDELTELGRRYYNHFRSLLHLEEAMKPTEWTRKLETAVRENRDLLALRVEYRELSLAWISKKTSVGSVGNEFYPLRQRIDAAIRNVVTAHDAMNPKNQEARMACMRGAVLFAGAVLGRESRAELPETNYHALARAQAFLFETFGKLADSAEKIIPDMYPNDLVQPGSTARASNTFELRTLRAVPYVPCDTVSLPDNEKLADGLLAMYAKQEVVLDEFKKFRALNNGSVNERQHAARLIDGLLGVGSAQLQESTIAPQDERRWQYETARQRLALMLEDFRQSRIELAKLFQDALVEAKPFISRLPEQHDAKAPNSLAEQSTARSIMINSLAADVCLRQVGRDHDEYRKTVQNDLSDGNAGAALTRLFEEVAHYRPTPR